MSYWGHLSKSPAPLDSCNRAEMDTCCQVECLHELGKKHLQQIRSSVLLQTQQQLYCFHICPNVFSLDVVTRSVSKGADWRENEECVFKCKGTVRKERRGDLEGFRKTRVHAFLAVKDKFEVNRWKSRKIYFRRFIILRINGGNGTSEVLYIPDNTQGYIPLQGGF